MVIKCAVLVRLRLSDQAWTTPVDYSDCAASVTARQGSLKRPGAANTPRGIPSTSREQRLREEASRHAASHFPTQTTPLAYFSQFLSATLREKLEPRKIIILIFLVTECSNHRSLYSKPSLLAGGCNVS